MKRLLLTFCSVAFLLVACNSDKTEEKTASSESSPDASAAKTDDTKKEQAWIPVDPAAAEKAMMDAAQLGEPHKMLAKATGTWSADMTYWQAPGAPESKITGTEVSTSILDGRFLQSTFKGDWNGMPFKGISTTGYDNVTKEYVSTWMENMSTGIMVMKGTWDNATNSINMTGKQKNPVNGIECTMRQVYKVVDDNNHLMEMYGPDLQTGKEFKMIEIKYTRKK